MVFQTVLRGAVLVLCAWSTLWSEAATINEGDADKQLTTYLSAMQPPSSDNGNGDVSFSETRKIPDGSGGRAEQAGDHLASPEEKEYEELALDKRRMDLQNFRVGLGKRRVDYRNFNVGLGKRSAELADDDDLTSDDIQQDTLDFNEDKRIDRQSFRFGLGKRPYDGFNFRVGLGKRRVDRHNFNFGVGKRYIDLQNLAVGSGKRRVDRNNFNFGLGKRRVDQNNFSFGLGKRKIDGSSFNFGMAKRKIDPNNFNFGLGKRQVDPNNFNFGLGKRAVDRNNFNFGLGKRKVDRNNFSFGLGRRTVDRNNFNFGLGKRRVDRNNFNFGLGKRQVDGMGFRFGLGKRRLDSRNFYVGLGKRERSEPSELIMPSVSQDRLPPLPNFASEIDRDLQQPRWNESPRSTRLFNLLNSPYIQLSPSDDPTVVDQRSAFHEPVPSPGKLRFRLKRSALLNPRSSPDSKQLLPAVDQRGDP